MGWRPRTSAMLKCPPHNARMAGDRRCQLEREERHCQPGAEMGLDRLDSTVRSQCQHHRVVKPERSDLRLTDHHPQADVAHLLTPSQPREIAVDRREEDAEVL